MYHPLALRRPLGNAATHQDILRQAVAYHKVSRYPGSGALLDLSGNGHNAQLGSSSGSDTNDPRFLACDGTWYVWMPGLTGNYASVPDAAALDITGDIDIRVRVAMADWTPSANASLLGKYNTTGDQRSYRLMLLTTGALLLQWSTDGTASGALSATSSAAVGATDGAKTWVRATLDVNNGAGGRTTRFYTSADGETWTELGTAQTVAATTSLHSGSAVGEVGASSAGSSDHATGAFYRAQVYASLDGSEKRLDIDFTNPSAYASGLGSLTAVSGQVVTLNRASSGRKLSVVDRPLYLMGTDDYLEIADHADLDFAAGDSFTVLVALRQYGTPAATQTVMSKSINFVASENGWQVAISASRQAYAAIKDGTNLVSASSGVALTGAVHIIGLRRSVADDLLSVLQGTTAVTAGDTTTATLANSSVLRIGRLSGGGTNYFDGEYIASAIFRRSLSSGEIQRAGLELLAP